MIGSALVFRIHGGETQHRIGEDTKKHLDYLAGGQENRHASAAAGSCRYYLREEIER
jgi:hypothetical protein